MGGWEGRGREGREVGGWGRGGEGGGRRKCGVRGGGGRGALPAAGGPAGADCDHRSRAADALLWKMRSAPRSFPETHPPPPPQKRKKQAQPAPPWPGQQRRRGQQHAGRWARGAGGAAREGRSPWPRPLSPGSGLRQTFGREEVFLLQNPPDSFDALLFYSGKL